jgi:hypothetical protein
MFLLRLASVMRNEEAEVNIIPQFPISKTTHQGHSFGGVVDFLVTWAHSEYTGAPTRHINLTTLTENFVTKDLLLDTPVAALASHNTHRAEHVTFEAKRDNVKAAFPLAVVAAASYCKEHKSVYSITVSEVHQVLP